MIKDDLNFRIQKNLTLYNHAVKKKSEVKSVKPIQLSQKIEDFLLCF